MSDDDSTPRPASALERPLSAATASTSWDLFIGASFRVRVSVRTASAQTTARARLRSYQARRSNARWIRPVSASQPAIAASACRLAAAVRTRRTALADARRRRSRPGGRPATGRSVRVERAPRQPCRERPGWRTAPRSRRGSGRRACPRAVRGRRDDASARQRRLRRDQHGGSWPRPGPASADGPPFGSSANARARLTAGPQRHAFAGIEPGNAAIPAAASVCGPVEPPTVTTGAPELELARPACSGRHPGVAHAGSDRRARP